MAIRTRFAHVVRRNAAFDVEDHLVYAKSDPLPGEIRRYPILINDARAVARNVRKMGNRSMATAAWIIPQDVHP